MIELRSFECPDFEQLISWIETPGFLMQWGGPNFRFPLDKQQLEDYLKEANQDQSTSLIYTVVEQQTGNSIGHISLGKIDRENRSARVGKVLIGDKSVRGKGTCQQMMMKILHIAFDELALHRVCLGVFDFNAPAISCYEKAGFKKEGLLRDSRRMGNEYWSLWEMSILENEWREE
ncbi:GNAT family N-acetyltransferase [Jeotgalibacillus campisalis]|uniref:Aminoglycoside 6-adenylyltransferase n=1 Tax=Jeotgalibacillus campisalis TaxID=220754 RepID=A0A0C2QYZ7_9BACL|nr:GNAT family protein [Jeotgalibacillus campisalis]KIL43275.1 aminoglycoside 6-adenylyltransferase [Jeotgalibacillus campisalis]